MTFALAGGTASDGSSRPDVAVANPHAPINCGFSYRLVVTKYNDEQYIFNVRVTDSSGDVAVFADVPLTISNSAPGASHPHSFPTRRGGSGEILGGGATLPLRIPGANLRGVPSDSLLSAVSSDYPNAYIVLADLVGVQYMTCGG